MNHLNGYFFVAEFFKRGTNRFHGALYVRLNDDGQFLDIARLNLAEQVIQRQLCLCFIKKLLSALRNEALEAANALQKKLDAFEDKMDEKLADAQKNLDDAMAAFSNELRALVVIPDFYFAGVEATSFDIAEVWANVPVEYKKDQESEDHHGAKVVFPKTAKLEWEWDEDKDKDGRTIYPNDYALSQLGKANYNINPSAFAVDAAKSWSFNGMNVLYTKAEDEDWAPVFEGISAKDGIATALFSIKNPENMYAALDGISNPSDSVLK